MMIETSMLGNAQELAVDRHTDQAGVERGMDMVDNPDGAEIDTKTIETWVDKAHMNMET
jgi:hypothetical protein